MVVVDIVLRMYLVLAFMHTSSIAVFPNLLDVSDSLQTTLENYSLALE